MNKTSLISIASVIVIGLLALAFWLSGSGNPSTTTNDAQSVEFPVANSIVNSTVTNITSALETTMSISTVNGESIKTKNFINDSTTTKDPINSDYYYLGYHVYEGVSDSTVTNNPPYIITYISATQYFNIALLQEPIGTTRLASEQFLISNLGISQNQMCQLNYMVSVPDRVNSQYAGKNLGFSFCPGATKLPQ
ncbi:MAG: hypothetical protein V1711_00085 [bacterium]